VQQELTAAFWYLTQANFLSKGPKKLPGIDGVEVEAMLFRKGTYEG
jgi:hypothetical protein